jgi:hypothetical protein
MGKAWTVGNQPVSKLPVEKVNEEIANTPGYLDEKQASYLLVKFFKANLGMCAKQVAGVDLFPFQEIAIKTMFKRDYVLGVWSRGLSKSWSTAVFAFLYAIFQPGAKIAIISRSFRQSREIFKRIEEIAEKPEGSLLAECFNGPVRHMNDEWTMKIGSSEIKALPLGDGEKLRGFRFNCLIIDELLLMPEKVMNEVLLPFLAVNADPKKRQDTYDVETEFIKAGLMTEEERTKFPNPKMIGLSSASYTFEHLYKIYEEYIEKITKGVQKEADGTEIPLKGSYAVLQFAYAIAPSQLYSASLIAKSRAEMSASQFKREFGAQFTDDSNSFYSAKAMEDCTIPFGQTPCIELKGDPQATYILAVDPSWAENEGSDFFAMEMFRLTKDGKFRQVHSYAVAGGKMKDHINYFHYLYTHFNPKFIVMDNAGGVQFLSSVNESKKFKDSKIQFQEIKEIDFEDTIDYQAQLRKARREYNVETRKIVYMQTFNSSWILRANHLLQANINNKRIQFAGEASHVEEEYNRLRATNIPSDLRIVGKTDTDENSLEETKIDVSLDSNVSDDAKSEAKMIDMIERQEFLIRLTKTQCALIEPKSTDGGHMSFVLPNNLKNQKGANKARKDLYTALLLGSWAVRCYNDMVSLPDEKPADWVPFFAK